jgi:hypothetical protein
VSASGAGESPNWSPSGSFFTVLSHGATGTGIDSVTVPESVADEGGYEATAAAFANAQLSSDPDAQRTLGVPLPNVTAGTRAAVLWVQVSADGTATARVRLTIDPRADHPDVAQAEETLTLAARRGMSPVVRSVTAEPLGPAPAGPQVVDVDTDTTPGAARLAFDSDLDPGGIPAAITLTTADNSPVASTASYDAATRTVTVRPTSPTSQPLLVVIGTGLRDVSHVAAAAEVRIPATLG